MLWPTEVKVYSTFGGTTWYSVRSMRPRAASARRFSPVPVVKIKKEGSPLSHYKKVKKFLDGLKQDIGDPDYQKLCELIEPLKGMCEQYERLLTNTLEEHAMVNVG